MAGHGDEWIAEVFPGSIRAAEIDARDGTNHSGTNPPKRDSSSSSSRFFGHRSKSPTINPWAPGGFFNESGRFPDRFNR